MARSITRRALPLLVSWICVLFPSAGLARPALTLISRSSGLELPLKEEGRTELEIGDVNGDGHLDVISVGDHGNPRFNSDEHGIMLWTGNGAGVWTVHQTGEFGYGGCALGDLDGDGMMDLAWGIHHNYDAGMGSRLISAARGNGAGLVWSDWGSGLASAGETWGMFATALADFDEDGYLDIVSESFGGSNGVRLYRNHGDGTWSQAWAMASGTVQYTIECCDVNGDGHADIACTRSGSNVLLGDGAFGFTIAASGLPGGTIHAIEAGDIDADGRDDILIALGSSGLRCLRYATGTGTWEDASSGLPASGAYSMCQLGDLDGDGDLDAIGYSAPTGRVYLGDGAGHWVADATWAMPSPGDASALRVDGDIDHDGREDIIVQATQSGFPFYRNQLRAYSPNAPPATLSARLVTPHGGEVLRIGSVRDIRWLAAVPAGQGPATVTLRLSLHGTDGPWTTIASGLPDNGRYQWRVASGTPSATCRMRVIVTTTGGEVAATSERDFSLLFREGADVAVEGGTRVSVCRILPNPAGERIVLSLGAPFASGCGIEIVSPSGERVARFDDRRGGRVLLPLTTRPGGARLPPGVYFVRIVAAETGATETLRLVKP